MTSPTHFTVPAPRRRRRSSEQVRQDERLVRRIRAALDRNPVAVVRALEILHALQTEDEVRHGATHWWNERGFRKDHAKRGKWLVETIIQGGRDAGFREDALLRGEALEMGRTIAQRYAATQLLRLAKAKLEEDAYLEALADAERARAAQDEADNRGTLGEERF
jgi:hypothetical protein